MIASYVVFILLFYGSQSLNESCFMDICFTIGKTNVNYTNALQECKKLNQTLAFILDKNAQLFIQNFTNSTNNTFYIGLKYIPKERFIWESNSNIQPDLNWSSNIKEPSSELCAYLSNDIMNVGNCSVMRNFICSNNTRHTDSEIINPNGSCANGFFKYLNKCYKMNLNCNDESKQWNEAQKMCRSFDKSSNLIVVNSMIEQEFLTALMTKSPQAIWTGLRLSSINSNVFQIWVDENDKMPVYRINFKKNEPNNIKNEKCLMVYHRLSNVGQFNDEDCSRYLNFICQGPLSTQNTSNKLSSQNPLFYQGKCKSKYYEFNETCYKVEKALLPYEKANKSCNGKLLYVFGFIDTAFIRSLMALEGVSTTWINVNSSDSIAGAESLQKEIKKPKYEAINSSLCYYINFNRKGLIQATSCSENHSYICYEFLDGHEKEMDELVCPLNWFRVGKKCFERKEHFSTFTEGVKLCKTYNSNVAKITSMKEAQAIKNKFKYDIWLDINGKSYVNNEWNDQTKLDYCLFRHTKNIYGENKANSNESCFIQRTEKLEWDIRKCNERKEVVCEQPAIKNYCPETLHINIDGDCYGKVDINMTWDKAEKHCQKVGGINSHLASFHSWDQEYLLLSKLNKTSRFWIGLRIYDFTKRWIDKSVVNYEQQSHISSYSEGMSCYSNLEIKDKIWWSQENCGTQLPFLCKISQKNVTYQIDERIIKPNFYCPKGFTKHGLGCFKLYDEHLTWSDADNKCKSIFRNMPNKARLARFNTLQEYESVLSSLRDFNSSVIWIGLYKHVSLKQYLWVDENPFNILKSVFNDSKVGENTVGMELSTNPFRNGRWIMLAGKKNFPFLCRVDPHEHFDNATDNPNVYPFTNISSSKCLAPFVEYNENCYYYNSKLLIFDDADKKCKSESAELLILDDNFEEHFVRSLLTDHNIDMKISWIGLKVYSENILQNWNTTSGLQVYYTHWSQLQTYEDPNNFLYDNPKPKIDGCYVLRHDQEVTHDNGMSKTHCYIRLPSICKKTLSMNHQILNNKNSCGKSLNGTYYDLDVRKTIDNEPCVRWDIVMNSNPFAYHLNMELISSLPFNKDGYISYSLDRCSEFRNDTKQHGYSCYIFKKQQFLLKDCLFKPCKSANSDRGGGHPFVIMISLILIISALCFLIYIYRRNILSIYRVRVFMANVLGRYQPDWLRDAHNRTQTGTVGGTGFTNPIYTPLESRY